MKNIWWMRQWIVCQKVFCEVFFLPNAILSISPLILVIMEILPKESAKLFHMEQLIFVSRYFANLVLIWRYCRIFSISNFEKLLIIKADTYIFPRKYTVGWFSLTLCHRQWIFKTMSNSCITHKNRHTLQISKLYVSKK